MPPLSYEARAKIKALVSAAISATRSSFSYERGLISTDDCREIEGQVVNSVRVPPNPSVPTCTALTPVVPHQRRLLTTFLEGVGMAIPPRRTRSPFGAASIACALAASQGVMRNQEPVGSRPGDKNKTT